MGNKMGNICIYLFIWELERKSGSDGGNNLTINFLYTKLMGEDEHLLKMAQHQLSRERCFDVLAMTGM